MPVVVRDGEARSSGRRRDWVAGFEGATPERLELLRDLLRTPPTVTPVPRPPPGWTIRLALDEPDAIELTSRTGRRHHAMGVFSATDPSVAVFEAGRIVAFGAPAGAERLRAALSRISTSARCRARRARPSTRGCSSGRTSTLSFGNDPREHRRNLRGWTATSSEQCNAR
jgi:hypothetical protein